MGKTLIITEKPSVAREYANILKVNGPRAEGLIENDSYVITWCVGHLVEMLYPDAYDAAYKKWTLEALPFLPRDYKYDVIANVKRQYEIVHHSLHREDIDTVLWAGDSGKEGQVIEENIRRFGGVRAGMVEKRVWIDSCTEEEILRGIKEAKPMSDYDSLANSGIMRSIEDYAVGINFSRALSVRYGNMLNQAAGTKSYTAIAIGRVMTCVLGLVVKREREIRNFKETYFYKVKGFFGDVNVGAEWKVTDESKYFQSPKLYKENGFLKKEDAEQFIQELQGKTGIINHLDQSKTTSKAPLLFNLAELQAECAKRYKISPDQTLSVAQNLYEKKLTTYPRTDARVLSTAIAKEISKNLYGLKKYEKTAQFTDTILAKGYHKNIANTQYTDDKKVTDHYAIIPTGNLTEYNNLSELEKSVYDMIVRRFLSIFYPPAVYDKISFEAMVDGEHFYASAKTLKSPGYLEIVGKDKPREDISDEERAKREEENQTGKALDSLLLTAKPGDSISVNDFTLKEGKTQPPKRYTSGSMVLAMENAGQFIEDEELRQQIKGSGIGTSATRAEIIAKLVNIGYLNLNKKSQVLTPEKFGEMVYEIVDMTVPVLLEPKMTASWEKGLDGITNGTVDMEDYRTKLEAFIAKETNQIKDYDLTGDIAEKIENFADHDFDVRVEKHSLGVACPLCGKDVETTPFGYGCVGYSKEGDGCKFSIGKIAGKRLPESVVKTLITTGKTEVLSGFVSKTGVPFKAALRIKEENGQKSIAFDFSEVKPDYVEDVVCPACGGKIVKTSFGYSCENRGRDGSGCYFVIGKIASKDISVEQLKDLLTAGKTDIIKGFTSQKGKKFEAGLELIEEDGKKTVQFYFPDTSPTPFEGVVCPNCGGQIMKTYYGFSCENALNGNEKCRFQIGKIAGRTMKPEEVKTLLTDGKSPVLGGFKSKTGKRFNAVLVLQKNEEGITNINFDFDSAGPEVLKDVKCPDCGGEIHVTQFGYGCSNYKPDKTGCNFVIGKIAEKSISKKEVVQLLNEKRTEPMKGFKSKDGKRFTARLILEKQLDGKHQVRFDFTDIEPDSLEDVTCPNCGGKMLITPNGFGCANYQKDGTGCNFFIGKIAEKMISKNEAIQLLKNGKTETISGFKSTKTNKKFNACLELKADETGKKQVVFNFEDVEADSLQGVTCPNCQGKMLVLPNGYGCANYQKDGTGCNFFIGKIAGKMLTKPDAVQLLKEGKTGAISGFKSTKTKKSFEAGLKLVTGEDGKKNIVFDFENEDIGVLSGAKCPVCAGDMVKTQFGYGCKNYSKDGAGCNFSVGTIGGKKLSDAIVRKLLNDKLTDQIEGFTSKSGKKFAAALKLEEDKDQNGRPTKRIVYVFPERPEPVEKEIACPKCGKHLFLNEWAYTCECGFKLRNTVAKKVLTDEDVMALLKDGKTGILDGFESKSGNVFSAVLTLGEDGNVNFDFEAVNAQNASSNVSTNTAFDQNAIDLSAMEAAVNQAMAGASVSEMDASENANFLEDTNNEETTSAEQAMSDQVTSDSDQVTSDSDQSQDDYYNNLAMMQDEQMYDEDVDTSMFMVADELPWNQ